MKRNILHSIVLLSALALASCSTTNQLASTQKADDDVYFSKAEAGEEPVYRQQVAVDRYTDENTSGNDDDYYYYDSYSSRINRFGYNSPFDYYDDYYYGYNPYAYNNYAGYGYGGWNVGIGLGFGYGGYGYGGYSYNPWGYGYGGGYGLGYGLGYGYGGFYSPYSYWGTGYGYGGGYWGVVSSNNSVARARPYRGSGFPSSGVGGRSSAARPGGYNGNYPNTMSYPGRRTNSVGTDSYSGNNSGRPSRGAANPQPVYRPQRTEVSRPTYQPASVERSSAGSSSGSYGGGGGGGSRGGGRPSRP